MINQLPNPLIGDIVVASDTKEVLQYTQDGWILRPSAQGQLNISLYDLNESLISQLPNLTEDELNQAKVIINKFHKKQKNTNYMLYSKFASYFTVFRRNNARSQQLGQQVISCLKSNGYKIKSIDRNKENNNIEIWAQTSPNEVHYFQLFPYDKGIVIF